MIESSLSKLEQLVSDLVQQKQELLDTNAALNAELTQAKDENESLQLNLMNRKRSKAQLLPAFRHWLSARALSAHERRQRRSKCRLDFG